MNKVMKAVAALMLMTAVVCAAGCTKTDDPNNGGNDNGGGNAGVLDGLFSVSATQKVRFSQGNLQYQASTNTWRFAEHQYEYMAGNNKNISETYDGWIDLFGWGTSGYNHGAVSYQPWSSDDNWANYFAYGGDTCNLYDQTGKADWGYNAISNGGNQSNRWRTLTSSEWNYLFKTRYVASGVRFVAAEVAYVKGVILFPDDWNSSLYVLNEPNQDVNFNYDANVISQNDWETVFEANGAVFLPAAGSRYGTSVASVGTSGFYWSSRSAFMGHNFTNRKNAYCIDFNYRIDHSVIITGTSSRGNGLSVRLVCPAE